MKRIHDGPLVRIRDMLKVIQTLANDPGSSAEDFR